jgi:scyllo-inositol 2-dehydrogenase (NADP+)
MKPINTAIIGFGLSGRLFHAPFINLNPNYHLSKIFSSKKKEINSIYPEVDGVQELDDIFNDPEIDLVVVASPNTDHYLQTKLALEKGKHVIVEKPFVTEIIHGNELIELASKQKKVLAVFQNRRWDGDFKTVKIIIDSGVLGNISEYEVHFDRFRPELDCSNWRTHERPGSGVFFDLGPHLIDQTIALFGLPEAVFGDIRIARKAGVVDDTFELTLFYKHLRAKLKAGVLVKELGPHFIIHGDNGSFVKYGLDPQENLLKQNSIPKGESWGEDNEEQYGVLNVIENGLDARSKVKTQNGNYMGFYNDVYKAIAEGKPLEVMAETALQNIHIILTAIESSKQGKMINL